MTSVESLPNRCPCCQQELEITVPLSFEDDICAVVRGRRCLELTPHQFTVLRELYERSPRVVSKEALMQSLYGLQADDDPSIKIVDIRICQLRKLLPEEMGLQIKTVWGRGFQLLINAQGE